MDLSATKASILFRKLLDSFAMEEKILKTFGKHLKALRKEYGLSQEALADKASLDRTYVSGVETGKRNISLKALSSIAKALDKNLSELFTGM